MKGFLLIGWAGALLLGSRVAFAQVLPAGSGSLTGTVLDSTSRQPVAYATVVVLPPAPNDQPLTGVAADEAGKFALTKLGAGHFRLRASYVGYAPRTVPVTVGAGPTAVGPVLLPVAAQALGEAVVVGQKPVVEVRPDRLIYNADQDVSNTGGTAQDVLRKAPLLAVDGEGTVTMRGSANFQVLVNNKPSPTLAKNLTEALKSIPAEQIQRIEVITTPSTKYDGTGTAGLINIVLKKGSSQGTNGRLGLSGGTRSSSVTSALTFRRGKFTVTSSANAGASYSPARTAVSRRLYSGADTDTLRREGGRSNRGGWAYGTVGLDYDPAAHHSFSLAGSVNYFTNSALNDLLTRFASPRPATNYQFARVTNDVTAGLNVEGTATYTRTFSQARKEWSVLGQYALTTGTAAYDYHQFDGSLAVLEEAQATYRERSRGRTPDHELTLQTDFTQPLGLHNRLDFGLKLIFRRTGSLTNVDTLHPRSGTELVADARRATDFGYDQHVQAAYGSYSFGVGEKLTASLGGRLERTAIAADFRPSRMGFDRAYLNLLTNASAQYRLSAASGVRAAYSRRITRPYIDYLNPFVNTSSAGAIFYGNPTLDPELTDSYELSYHTSVKTTTLTTALSVRHTSNAIEQVRLSTPEPGIIASTYANVAANTFYQFNLNAALKPLPQWDLSVGPDVQYIVRRSPALQAGQQGFTASLTVNTSYKLTQRLTVQSFLNSSLPQPQLQGRGAANLYYAVGAKKTLWQEQADVTLTIACPFNERWAYRSTAATPAFDQTSTLYAYQRSFRLSFGYHFGQAGQTRQHKSIQNTDIKGGQPGG